MASRSSRDMGITVRNRALERDGRRSVAVPLATQHCMARGGKVKISLGGLTLPAIFLFLAIGLLGAQFAKAMTNEDCINIVAAVNRSGPEITSKAVDDFLYSLGAPECRGNGEYAEWSNETLFHLMEDVPALLFARVKTLGQHIEDAVVRELKEPIHDMLNYPAIYDSINTKIGDEGLRAYAMKIFEPFYRDHVDYVQKWEKNNNLKWEYERR